MDPLRKVTAGTQVVRSAARENAWSDAARWVQSRQIDRGRGRGASDASQQQILVRNNSGADRDAGHILCVESPIVLADDNLAAFRQTFGMVGNTPSSDYTGRFVVLAQPIKNGKIGPAYASGVVAVKVNIVDASHRYADVKDGDCTQLESCSSGAALILAVGEGTGPQWAYVRIGGGGGGGSGSKYPACNIICDTESIPANSLARIVSYNRKADCYLVKRPDKDNISLSQLVWVPDAVPVNTVGVGMLDFGSAPLLTDDNVKPGDSVGTAAGSWKAKQGNNGLEVAALISGTMSYVNIVDPGSGYATAPTITHAAAPNDGGASRQATFLVKLDGDKIGSVIVLDSGADYTSAPTLVYAGNAILEAVIVGQLDSLAIEDGGAGYEPGSHPGVTIGGGGTAPASGIADVDDTGKVSALHLTARGFGFFTAPTVTIAPPPAGEGPKRQATAKAVLA